MKQQPGCFGQLWPTAAAVSGTIAALLLMAWLAQEHSFLSTRVAWVPGPVNLTSFPPQVKVYVYDLPSKYNTDLRYKYNCDTDLYMAFVEIWLHEALLNNTAMRTDDPEAADFYFVPLYSECYAQGLRVEDQLLSEQERKHEPASEAAMINQTTAWFESAVRHIWDSQPYFNRTFGRDHIFVFPYGHGPMRFNTYYANILESIFLTPAGPTFSPELPTWEYSQTWKDVLIPLYHSYAHGRGRERRKGRKYLAFFAGNLANKRPIEKLDPRALLAKAMEGQPDALLNKPPPGVNASPDGHEPTYWELLLDSVFCLAPEGKHPNSLRPFESMAGGCIPVIVADQFELPFEDLLDWREFSIKVPEARASDIMSILRAVPQERIEAKRDAIDRVWRAFQYPTPTAPGDALHYIGLELARKKRVLKNGPNIAWDR